MLRILLLSPFGSAKGDGTRWSSLTTARDGDGTGGMLVRIRDRSIARKGYAGYEGGKQASKQASKHGQGSKAGRLAGLRNVTYSSRPWLY